MKRTVACGASLFLALVAVPSRAQVEVDDFGAVDKSATFESPQNMAVELRIGPYLPNIDEEFEGTGVTPFADHFGNDTRWHLGFEVDWQLLRFPKLGSLGPGVGMGLTNMEGTSVDETGAIAEQTTTLTIAPMHLVGVMRVDAIAQRTPVPLVPYAKLGLGYALWWTNDGQNLERASANGRTGEDTSYGLVWALGVQLMLDVFDRASASNLDATYGVNHSYVFVEWFNSDLDGFDSGKLQVGVNTWMLGLTLEM
jgi:hypothetical protein